MGEDFFEGKGVVSSRRNSMEKVFKIIAKIPDKSWKAMEGGFKAATEFMEEVGTIPDIKENIKTQVKGMFSPIENEITQFSANLISDTGLGGALNKIGNSVGNLLNTVLAPESGLGKAVNFIGDAVANTLDFAAKGWESLISGRNAFQAEFQETILATTGGGLLPGGGSGSSILGGSFDDEVLRGILEDMANNQEEGF